MPSKEYIDEMVESFIEDIKHMKQKSSYKVCLETCKLLGQLVQEAPSSSPQDLKHLLKEVLEEVNVHLPKQNCVCNLFHKFLKLCSDEIDGLKKEKQDDSAKLDIKDCLMEVIDEMVTEIETSTENIGNLATQVLHPGQRVLTVGASHTLKHFFKEASKEFSFDLFIMENYPKLDGHEMALHLSSSCLLPTILTDASSFSLMPRIDAVVISAASITADGGAKCLSGCYNVALAAKHYNVPLYVCAPIYKFSPQHLRFIQQDHWNTFLSSERVMVCAGDVGNIETHLPLFDFVPPSLISLILTNLGGNEPSQMYRFLNELYDYEECVLAMQ